MMKKNIIGFVVVIQLVLICILLIWIKRSYFPANSPIDPKTIRTVSIGELKYFYEPEANAVVVDDASWSSVAAQHTINKDSLNERFNYDIVKKPGVFRILTVGDSFTYGLYIDTKDNWTELLEDYLNTHNNCRDIDKYEVINLGVPGYDLAYETQRYISRGEKYSPNLIIMLISEFGRITEHRILNQGKIVLPSAQKEAYKKQGNYFPETSIIDNTLSTDFRIHYQETYFKKLMAHYKNKLLLVDFEQNPLYQSTLRQLVKSNINVTLQKTQLTWNDKEFFFPDSHLNILGHQRMMKEIVEELKRNNFFPCH